jgi:hypothetical protein
MTDQTLAEVFNALVQTCAASEAGREALAMHDHIVQFTPLDGDTFYFAAKGGKGEVAQGVMPERPITETHEIKANSDAFQEWFSGLERLSDLIEEGRMFPVASHTTKRHIDHWLAKIVRIGNGQSVPKEVY